MVSREPTGAVEPRILCWGPASSGKTTVLRSLHARFASDAGVPLLASAGPSGETLFVDVLGLEGGRMDGRPLRFLLVGVPGRDGDAAGELRRRAAAVADGVLFVADSTPERLGANAVSLRELESLLAESGRRDLPLVLVYNKRDLPGALPVERLETELNLAGRESFEAVATRGEGLAEALVAVSRRVVEALV